MSNLTKVASLVFLLLVITASIIVVGPVMATDSLPTPRTPQFTIIPVSRPYTVPEVTPTYTIDPYNGERKLVSPGSPARSGVNKYIELHITNQQYTLSNGSSLTVYYTVRLKGHFDQEWTERSPPYTDVYDTKFIDEDYPQSNSETTIIIISVDTQLDYPYATYPPDAQIDFQVSAMVGSSALSYWYPHIGVFQTDTEQATALLSQSAWSDIQTISLSDYTVTATTSANPTTTLAPTNSPGIAMSEAPTVTSNPTGVPNLGINWLEFTVFVGLAIIIVVLAIFLLLQHKRIRVLELKQNGT